MFVADYDAGTVSKITPLGVKSVFADGMSYLFNVTTDPGGKPVCGGFQWHGHQTHSGRDW